MPDKLYRCPNCDGYWYYGDDGEPRFYGWWRHARDDERRLMEDAEDKPCGCTEH